MFDKILVMNGNMYDHVINTVKEIVSLTNNYDDIVTIATMATRHGYCVTMTIIFL